MNVAHRRKTVAHRRKTLREEKSLIVTGNGPCSASLKNLHGMIILCLALLHAVVPSRGDLQPASDNS